MALFSVSEFEQAACVCSAELCAHKGALGYYVMFIDDDVTESTVLFRDVCKVNDRFVVKHLPGKDVSAVFCAAKRVGKAGVPVFVIRKGNTTLAEWAFVTWHGLDKLVQM